MKRMRSKLVGNFLSWDSIDRQMCITCTCTWWVLSVFVVSIQCDSDSFRFFRVIHTLRAFPSPIQWTVCTSECSWHRHANWTPNSSGTFIVRSSRPFRDFSDSLAVVGDQVIEYWEFVFLCCALLLFLFTSSMRANNRIWFFESTRRSLFISHMIDDPIGEYCLCCGNAWVSMRAGVREFAHMLTPTHFTKTSFYR